MTVEEQATVPHPARWGVLYRSSGPLWDAAMEHELTLQRCASCHRWLMPPRPMCPQCQSMESEWVPVSGEGTIYSWVTYAEAPDPAFESPHTVVLVQLAEGPRVVSNVVGIAPEELEVGLPVRVVFEDVDDALSLFKFERAA
jgi:uncharacterized OB-fold protein